MIAAEDSYWITSPVIIDGTTASGEVILDGTGDIANVGVGLYLEDHGSTVRGLTIGNFVVAGIQIFGDDHTIEKNYIGITRDGTDFSNSFYGIEVFGGSNNRIGGVGAASSYADLGKGNVIGYNGSYGIKIHIEGDDNIVSRNFIGVHPSGENIGNGGDGIIVASSEGTIIGGPTSAHGNRIGFNGRKGILVVGDSTFNTTIRNNYIGTDNEGNDYGNAGAGIFLYWEVEGTKIGGSQNRGNVIGFNESGIVVVSSSNNVIRGNFIGVNRSGTPIGNTEHGIHIESSPGYPDALNNTIGYGLEDVISLDGDKGNMIAWNEGPGIVLTGDQAFANTIRGNSIFDNGSAIDLGDDGFTVNDSDDADIGPNQLQNYPDIHRAFYRPGNDAIAIEFTVSSDDTTANYPLTIDAYFAHDDAGWEGETYIGTVIYDTPNATGLFEIPADDVEWTLDDIIVLTATDAEGNTSEFSPASTPLSDGDGGPLSALHEWQIDKSVSTAGQDIVRLSQPYPNPFNPQATFALTLPEMQHVRVSILDLLGREVDVLHEGPLSSGTPHEFTIDGRSFSSGTYFVRVRGDQFVEMRQVTLLK